MSHITPEELRAAAREGAVCRQVHDGALHAAAHRIEMLERLLNEAHSECDALRQHLASAYEAADHSQISSAPLSVAIDKIVEERHFAQLQLRYAVEAFRDALLTLDSDLMQANEERCTCGDYGESSCGACDAWTAAFAKVEREIASFEPNRHPDQGESNG